MLYISRKIGEKIIINNNIIITITEIKGNKVKLGCEFPPECSLLREELYEKIQEQNNIAVKSNIDKDIFDKFLQKFE
jgi:carbon storage regulator